MRSLLKLLAFPFTLVFRPEYKRVSRLGSGSPNPWIRKSSEIDGIMHKGEHELLWDLAARGGPGHILEIGAWEGKSTCILAGACKEKSPDARVFCVDSFDMGCTLWQESLHKQVHFDEQGTYYRFVSNAKRLGFYEWVVPVAGRSELVLPYLPVEFRLVFVDGGHGYEQVKKDVELALPKLLPGGLLAMHDALGVTTSWPGVAKVVRESLSKDPSLKEHSRQASLLVFEKKV